MTGVWLRFLSTAACAVLLGWAALAAPAASAQPSAPRAAEVSLDDEALLFTADFNVTLTQTLEDALARGVALYFVREIEVVRERLVINESIASRTDNFRLAYIPLIRSWRLTSGLYTQNIPTLEAAVRQISRLSSTRVAERKLIQKGEKYVVTVKLRHDLNQLPKPLQLNALGSRDWQIDVEPVRVVFVP